MYIDRIMAEVGGCWFLTAGGSVIGACLGVPFAFLRSGSSFELTLRCQREGGFWALIGKGEGELPTIDQAVGLVRAKTGK